MAWLKCKPGDSVKSPIYLIENNQAVVPYSGGAVQTASGVRLQRDANRNKYWQVSNIDITKYSKIIFTYNITSNSACFYRFQVNGTSVGTFNSNQTGTFTNTINISNYTGNSTLGLYTENNYGTAYIQSLRLEK